jgi:pSer/pThr/pTyr-binding forkhead associated (FHA) protein
MARSELPDTTVRSLGGAPSPGRALLLVIGAGHFGTYPVPDDGELILGRDPACGVPLAHDKISRRHARVRAGVVEDLGSTNGIVIGGKRLGAGASARLEPGDSFQLGPFTALFLRASEPELSADGVARAALTVADPTRAASRRPWRAWPRAP